jgi:methionyl aminopeptidase
LAAERAEIGRNDRCYCGSGKKYKNCHLAEDEKRGRGAQLSQEQMMRQASDSVSGPQRKKKP